MSVYETAVQKLYGNLTVDLRPTTLELERLQPNILTNADVPSASRIIKDLPSPPPESRHMEAGSTSIKEEQPEPPNHLTPDTQIDNISKLVENTVASEDENMPSCDDCGIVFENNHDLQRHVRTWCPENGGEPLQKRAKVDAADDTKNDILRPVETGTKVKGIEYMWEQTLKACKEDIWKKKEDFQDKGKSERWVEKKLRKCWQTTFLDRLAIAIRYASYFGYGPLFKPILEKITAMDPDMDPKEMDAKITQWMKPIVKDILSHVDLSQAEDLELVDMSEHDDTDDDEL
ncbi:uncharacterized protein LOC124285104 [Haliotis rubra]|uniref:uncharacterized protein LOC124285104 n=1 Tax=Haliotis rubra TaxID=36100 RepID=UPI001EE58653|nr:uncharacterized protein LOC124285104 [Haliotis rubra]